MGFTRDVKGRRAMPIGDPVKNIIVFAIACGVFSMGLMSGGTPAEAAAGRSQTFVVYKYIDPAAGMEAFRLLIPKGWRAEGAITWSANPALPATSRFRFYNPEGQEEFNLFPMRSYFWTNNQLSLRTNPPGTLWFGTPVAAPIDLHAAFTKVIIPAFRKKASGLTVIREQDVPELVKLARGEEVQGVRISAAGGKMRIGYHEDGRHKEEELYAAVSQVVTDIPGGYSGSYYTNYWFIDYIFSFKAEKGGLDSRARTFQTMVYSFKVNPRWFAKVVNVKELLVKRYIQGIKAIGKMGSIVAQSGSQMREEQQRDWERRQEVKDRIAQNFSDNIRGVERYNDPHSGKEVELPSGYGNAWSNNLGEYIITDSPSYNPNVGSNLHWEQMTPAR